MKNFKLALYDRKNKKVYKWKELDNINPWLLWSVITSNKDDKLRQDYEILLFTWLQDYYKKDIYEWDSITFWYDTTSWENNVCTWPVIYDKQRASFFVKINDWDLVSLDALFNYEDYREELKELWFKCIVRIENNWPDYDYLFLT